MNRIHLKRVSSVAAAREGAFHAALTVLAGAKQRHANVRQHRAISRLSVGPHLVMQTIFLPIFFCGLLIWGAPYLFAFWRECILFWANNLGIPLVTNIGIPGANDLGLSWSSTDQNSYLPGLALLTATTLVTLLAFAASFMIQGSMLPVKYLIRILCVVQAASLLFFIVAPASFPYAIINHMNDMINVGYALVVAAPAMLALGYYALNVGFAVKVKHTLMILAYIIIMIPYQIVMHVLILQHFSVLFMPVLYLCFGAIFDVLIFVALYSWAASNLPANATT